MSLPDGNRWAARLREAVRYRIVEAHRRLWRYRRRPTTVRLPEGPALRLYPDSELAEILLFDDFETAERALVRRFLRPGDIFVDVGANIGLFTVIAAPLLGPAGRVYAFEPYTPSFDRLRENICLNGYENVECVPLGLSDHPGPADFTVSLDGFDAWNSLGKPARGERLARCTIECTTWDQFNRERGLQNRVSLLKIDVEGWETRVLNGGRETFTGRGAPPVLIEFSDSAARHAGSSCRELYGLIHDLGYQLYSFDLDGALTRERLRETYPYVNLLALKDIDYVEERLRT
jgi:FkbM family methyltransferase